VTIIILIIKSHLHETIIESCRVQWTLECNRASLLIIIIILTAKAGVPSVIIQIGFDLYINEWADGMAKNIHWMTLIDKKSM